MVGKILILISFLLVYSEGKPVKLETSLTVLPLPVPGKEAITHEEIEAIDLFELEPPAPGQIVTTQCAEGYVKDPKGDCVEKIVSNPEDLCALFGIGCK